MRSPLSLAARCDALAHAKLFATLTEADREELAQLATERRVVRDETVLHRGAMDASLLVVVDGQLRTGAVSAEGREVAHASMPPGTVLGEIALLDGGPRSTDVVAVDEARLLVLERRVFLPFLMARPALMMQLLTLLCERLRSNNLAYEAIALSPLSARLARLLLTLAAAGTREPGGVRLHATLKQREMGLQVAASRERVNKQLRQWVAAGVLGGTPGRILVRDAAALRAAADG